ncbi:MAG: hypothetical protein ACREUT_11045 [Steroidobacteraceae bacterium]
MQKRSFKSKVPLRWLGIALIFAVVGTAVIIYANWESDSRDSISIAILRESAAVNPTLDAVSLNVDEGTGIASIRLARQGARMIVIALSHLALMPEAGRSVQRSTCEASASDGSDILHGPVLTDIRYKSGWLGVPFGKEVDFLYGAAPTLVIVRIPPGAPDDVTVNCELNIEPVHENFVKRGYRVLPLTLPIMDAVKNAAEKAACTSQRPCLSEDPPPIVNVTSSDDAFPNVRRGLTPNGFKIEWYDEHASQARDVLLILVGTLFGMAGAGVIEYIRHLWT